MAVIAIIMVFALMILSGSWEYAVQLKDEMINEMGVIPSILLILFSVSIVMLMLFLSAKFDKLPEERKKIVEKSFKSLADFWWMMAVMILLFLGAYHSIYQYESTFYEDMHRVLGVTGDAIANIYEIGEEQPVFWFWFPIAPFFMFLYYLIMDIKDGVKEWKEAGKNG